MLSRFALAFAAPLVMSATIPEPMPELDTPPIIANFPGVVQIRCNEGRGTGFRTGTNAITSANHVTGMTNCMADGEPLVTTYASNALDFSSGRIASQGDFYRVDCGGFKPWRTYAGVGYARGTMPHQRITVVQLAPADVAAEFKWGDFTTLIGAGRFIPGQSGAPVFDLETGDVVGIIKGLSGSPHISYARDLSTTPLCTGHA